MTEGIDARLQAAAAAREAAGLTRRLRARPADEPIVDLAGNDYLGLARHPEVIDGAVAAARRWGAGATGSRLVTGTTELHEELEARFADFTGQPAALVLSSGYAANLAVITALAGPDVLIVSDAANHASIVDACRLGRSPVAIAAHRDTAAVAALLAGRTEPHALVVTDAVFSVDGDAAPLAELATVCRAAGAWLLVDEAHSLGVLGAGGRGAVHAAGLQGAADVVVTATLSKAFGAQGGLVLGPAAVREHLVNTARAFIFDTALAPPTAGAALAALALLQRSPDLPQQARGRATDLHAAVAASGLTGPAPDAAVTSALIGEASAAVAAADACWRAGVRVGCFRPPSVPDADSRLRLTARADLSDADLEQAAAALAAAAEEAVRR